MRLKIKGLSPYVFFRFGGILIFQMPVPADRAALERDLLRDRAYTTLRDAIVDGTLHPGERLRDQELTEWLGLSRTPVRDALSRLEQDGLVETEPQRFTRVAPLDRRAARDAFPIVAAVHALAAELGVPRLTAADLDAMRAANARFAAALKADDVDAALNADDAFHRVLITASANSELSPTLDRLMPRLRRLERLRFGSLAGRGSVRQHDEIVAAATRNDVQTTAERVRENWLSLGTLIDRSFE
jgi:DNA-binding GntR family transcriptional regulator